MPIAQNARKDKIPAMGRNSCFPMKLHQVLQYATVSNMEKIIRWNENGTAFLLLNQDEFMEHIASHFFPNQKRYRSFERLLNLWGFERQISFARNVSCWANPHFRRDRPELCKYMVRIENKGTKKKVPTGPKTYRYAYIMTAKLPFSMEQQAQATLEFFSRQKSKKTKSDEDCRDGIQDKGVVERLPLKKRLTRFQKHSIGPKHHCPSKTTPSAMAAGLAGDPQAGETHQLDPSSLNNCPRMKDSRFSELQKENSTSGSHERLKGRLQKQTFLLPNAKAARKRRPTSARRRQLPTKVRLGQLDARIRHFREALEHDAGNLLYYRLKPNDVSATATSSPVDKASAQQNGFGAILPTGTIRQKVAHVEGQFDDASECDLV